MTTRHLEAEAREVILGAVSPGLRAKGLAADEVADDFDLLLEGAIDSFGLVELIGMLEERFGITVELERLDPDEVTLVGPLSRYVATEAGKARDG